MNLTMRIRYRTLGGHTHMTFFAGMARDPDAELAASPAFSSLGNCGHLTMRNEEFEQFREALELSRFAVQFVDEEARDAKPE